VSDLSRLLGDVYGASSTPAEDLDAADATTPMAAPGPDDPPAAPVEAAEARRGPAAPGWADERVLDEAFAEWVPGPPPDASAEERGMLADVDPAETVAEPIDIDAWFDDELAGADADVDRARPGHATQDLGDFEAFVPEPEAAVEQDEPAGPWTRTSDDLLPRGRRTRRLSLSIRR
jgi:hypothetical protein